MTDVWKQANEIKLESPTLNITLQYGIGTLYFRKDEYKILAGDCIVEETYYENVPHTEVDVFFSFETSALIYRKIYDENSDIYCEYLYFFDIQNNMLRVFKRKLVR